MKFVVILLALIATPIFAAPSLYSPLEPWNGEYLQENYGALYTRIFLDNFPRVSKQITANPNVHIRNIQTNKRFVISQTATMSTVEELQIWKIPVGDYVIEKITINDNAGATRTWKPPKVPRISVRYLFLSNLGDIRVSPYYKGLKVRFVPSKNLYKNSLGHDSFVGVIDGYSTKVQAKLGGGRILRSAQDEFGSRNEARAAFSMTRTISMIYRVDSTGTQSTRRIFSNTLNAQDSDLRRCYMDELELVPGLRGTADFQFQLAPKGGTFSRIKYRGGDMQSPKTIECLTLTLGKIQFPINQRLAGRVTFVFDYKEDMGRSAP